MLARVYKGVGSIFDVVRLSDNKLLQVKARGIIKQTDKIYIGDIVKLEESFNGEIVIVSIIKRKNELIRPNVANVDTVFIVVSSVPMVDFVLLDKQIIYLLSQNIDCAIIVNKIDMKASYKVYDYLKHSYSKSCNIYVSSTKIENSFKNILSKYSGKIVALAGQSGVGKSSLINTVKKGKDLEVANLSNKINRGKNTTRTVEIFDLDYLNVKIIDTCGFSSFYIENNIDYKKLHEYYIDFADYIKNCSFSNKCRHISENVCGVIDATKSNKYINKRYNTYIKLYNELKDKEENRY